MIGRRLGALMRRPVADWLLLGEAFVALSQAHLALRVRRFATIDRALRRPPSSHRPAANGDRATAAIKWAIATCVAHGPIRFLCFPQAIAAQAMLRRRGVAVAVHYGVRRAAEGKPMTHAWAMRGAQPVTGASGAADFTLLHIFAADADPA